VPLRQILRLRTQFPALLGLALVTALLGCGSSEPPGPNAVVDVDPLTPGDTLPNPDTPPPPPDLPPTPDPLPNPDTLPPPDDPLPPDSVPDSDPPPNPDSLPAPEHSGVPFGPFGLWAPNTSIDERLPPFTGSHNFTDPDSIVGQITAARAKNHRLLLNMTGGPSSRYTTNGKFDLTKWKNRMNRFNTPVIQQAVAAGVADGTVVGNSVIDEPETRQWGDIITKQLLDEMGAYVKAIFPTLPVGVDQGPPAYRWRVSERFRVLDYVIYQYAWWVTGGNISEWRKEVEALAKRDGVALGFSLNVLNGGVQDRKGWDCAGTGGKGRRPPNCQMTSEQLLGWAKILKPEACVMLLWRYDAAFMSKSANQNAFKDLAAELRQAPKRSCRRP
jgi:hypothetical protein